MVGRVPVRTDKADGGYRTLKTGQVGMIHPGSTLFTRKCSLVRWLGLCS